jgi:hypothetical protein
MSKITEHNVHCRCYRTHTSTYKTAYTVGMYTNCSIPVPENEPSGSKHVENTVKIKILTKVHSVGLYYTVIFLSLQTPNVMKIKTAFISFVPFIATNSVYQVRN